MTRHLHRCSVRFPRTASEAFRDHTYGAAIERPMPSLWRRLLTWFWRDFA
jgi:hypothetical protein